MKLRIISIGTKMPDWVQAGFEEYHKRILPMLTVELVALPAAKRHKNPTKADIAKYKQIEGEAILTAVGKSRLWLLEVTGKMISTELLAKRVADTMQEGIDVAVVIGGADGVSQAVLERADVTWSLSPLTLPHPLVRVVLIEQLYRAMSIIHNHPYHRGG